MKKLFNEYVLVILAFLSSLIGIEIALKILNGNSFLKLIIKEVQGL